ncbi:ankyrin repeat-containing domain protein [Aspergillus desertorum]
MLFLDLPDELLLSVGEVISSQHDLSSLTKTNRRLYCLLSDLLLRNNMQSSNSSALVQAAQHGNLTIVQRMIELGADIDATNPDAYTALDCAASEGHADIVRCLLEKGARHRFTSDRPCTPLGAAAAAGHTDVIRIFLDHHDAEPEKQQDDQSTPSPNLGTNIAQRTVLNMFTTNVSRTEREALEYAIPLFLAILHSQDRAALSLIEDRRVNINYRDLWERTPLMWALTCGRRKLAKSLLQQGADANAHYGHSGLTVLIAEIRRPKARNVKLLLAHDKVDPNLPDRHSCTPLWAALESWDVTMLKHLLARPDLDVNRPREGITPLLHAISNRQEEVAALLLKHPSLDSTSINSMDPNGRTPLSYASEYGQISLIDILLEKGADPASADIDGHAPQSYDAAEGMATQAVTPPPQTGRIRAESSDIHGQDPIFWAIYQGDLDTLETLVSMGADPSQQNEDGHTPLHCLVKRSGRQPILAPEDEQAMRFLLNHGADPGIKDGRGMTALDLARVYGWGELMGGILRSSSLMICGAEGRGGWGDANIHPSTSEDRAAAGACWTQRRSWRIGVGYETGWVEIKEPWRVR